MDKQTVSKTIIKIRFCNIIAAAMMIFCFFSCDTKNVITLTTTDKSEVNIGIKAIGNITIDWGDGRIEKEKFTISDQESLDFHHSYSTTSTRTITITGNISYLDCSDNWLSDIDISKNTKLENLDCSDNDLRSLDVSKNTALTHLKCNSNDLRKLDISKNTKLIHLDCYSNNLKSLDVNKNRKLEFLNCSNNEITKLNVSKNNELSSLQCYGNQLTSLDVGKNTKLGLLRCHGNQLISLDVSKNTKLGLLWCHGNQLTSIEISKNDAPLLNWIYCGDNMLRVEALNSIFEDLNNFNTALYDNVTGMISIGNNPGANFCNRSIAEKKGWRFVRGW